jgi:hypothetical protein
MFKEIINPKLLYHLKLKTLKELKEMKGVIISNNLVTVKKFTSYGAHKYAGKVIKASYGVNYWLSDKHFTIPRECVKEIYISKERQNE